MEPAWPATVRPFEPRQLAVLARPRALQLYLALLEGPLDEADVRLAGGAEGPALCDALVGVGLAKRLPDGAWSSEWRHLRLAGDSGPDRMPFREAVLTLAESIVEDGRRTLHAWNGDAKAGLGIVTLPDDPALLPEVTRILAEAEDKLKALGGRAGPTTNRLRVTFLVTSTDEPFA